MPTATSPSAAPISSTQPTDDWIPIRAAARIAQLSTRNLRRRLLAVASSSPGVLRRFGAQGHWWVHVGALRDLMVRSTNPTDQISDLWSDLRRTQNHLEFLRDSHFALKRKVNRLAIRQQTNSTTDAPLL